MKMSTIWLVTWSRGRWEEYEQGVLGWSPSEELARSRADGLNQKFHELKDWYRGWYADNPAPIGAHFAGREQFNRAYDGWDKRRKAAVREHIKGEVDLLSFVNLDHGFNPYDVPDFGIERVESI